MPEEDTLLRLRRLVAILRLLEKNERVSVKGLSEEFGVCTRTINRDIKFLREAGFRIDKVAPGVYTAQPSQLEGLEVMDSDEVSFLIASRRLVRQILPEMEERLDVFLRCFLDDVSLPVHISADIPQTLSDDTIKVMRSLLNYIYRQKEVTFRYKDEEDLRKVEPYRMAYLRGFWYLIAKDTKDSKLKSFAIDRIKELSTTKRPFSIPDQIEGELQKLYYPYLTDGVRRRVKVRVASPVAHYFKRKKFDVSQTIEQELKNGDLIVSFLVPNTEPIKNFVVKPWLPHVTVLKPESLRDEIRAELKEWLKNSSEP